MIRVVLPDRLGAIQLFGQHHPDQHVRPDHRAEADRQVGLRADLAGGDAEALGDGHEVGIGDLGKFAAALAESRAYWNNKSHAAPKNLVEAPPGASLARQQMSKLKVYSGPDHPHAAQQPQPYEITQIAQ